MAPTLTLVWIVIMVLVKTLCLAPTWVVNAEGPTPVSCNAETSDLPQNWYLDCSRSSSTYLYLSFGRLQTYNPDLPWYEDISDLTYDDNNPVVCAVVAKNVYSCCDKFTLTLTSPSSLVITYNNTYTVSNLRIQTWIPYTTTSCRTNAAVPSNSVLTAPETAPNIDKLELCYDTLCAAEGSVCGDPKLVGGDGVTFYFHGRKDQDFCLVSDSDLHINAHFIGKRPAGRTRDFTWVQALGFVYGSHTLTIAVKRVAEWDNTVDHLEFSYNGQALALSPKSSWTSPGAAMTLVRGGAANVVDLEIKEKMGVSLNAVPIGKHESDVHHYGITGEDCFAHLDMQFRFHNLSKSVNGVLGQTYQPGFVNPVRRDVAMPVMGGAERFESSSLVGTDCAVSQYTATAVARASVMPSFEASCGSSDLPGGVPGGITCRR